MWGEVWKINAGSKKKHPTLFCHFTEWSSWTEDTFQRWTLQPTSSRSADSSTECAGKLVWCNFSLGFVPRSRCPGVQFWLYSTGKIVQFQPLRQLKAPRGHRQWIWRAAADKVPKCWFSTHSLSWRLYYPRIMILWKKSTVVSEL